MVAPLLRPNCRGKWLRDQRGVAFVVVFVLLASLWAALVFAVDGGLYFVTRNELQNAADAAALAGARQLGQIFRGGSPSAEPLAAEEQEQIVAAATAAGAEDPFKNKVNGSTIEIPATDIEIGNWSAATFSRNVTPLNAVFVRVQRSDNVNHPLPTYLAGTMGIKSLPVYAKATAFLQMNPARSSSHLVEPQNAPYKNVAYRP